MRWQRLLEFFDLRDAVRSVCYIVTLKGKILRLNAFLMPVTSSDLAILSCELTPSKFFCSRILWLKKMQVEKVKEGSRKKSKIREKRFGFITLSKIVIVNSDSSLERIVIHERFLVKPEIQVSCDSDCGTSMLLVADNVLKSVHILSVACPRLLKP